MPELPALDLTLLQGGRFRCRPGCGLCCYTSPAVTLAERSRLLQISPELQMLEPEGGSRGALGRIASRADGGACQLLESSKCRLHEARPYPCRAFPLHVTLERRAQASLILSCPGVDLSRLPTWGTGRGPQEPPQGLDEELHAVREEIGRTDLADRFARGARSWERTLRALRRAEPGTDPEAVVQGIVRSPPLPTQEDFPATPPPPSGEDLERLPLHLDPERGIVAWSEVDEGWELVWLREEGGIREVLGVFPPPVDLPRRTDRAESVLRGYLSYVARRDHFLSLALSEWRGQEDLSFAEVAGGLVREVAAQVLARGIVGAMVQGRGTERLDTAEVELGVRAIDLDFLDQPTLGEQL